MTEHVVRGLPWTPKVRSKDVENFLENTRMKFVGFKLSDDTSSLAGLPNPIHEGVRVLNQYVYHSLADTQIKYVFIFVINMGKNYIRHLCSTLNSYRNLNWGQCSSRLSFIIFFRREEEIAKNPMSKPELDVSQTPAEILYQAMLPSLPQYMIALLKVMKLHDCIVHCTLKLVRS